MAKQLFTKKDTGDVRTKRIPVRVSDEEAERIKHAAKIRQMDASEFMRRSALGRKADVDYETEIVLALSEITRRIRQLHAALVERGVTPPEAEMLPLILEARAAMLRIAK